MTRRFAMAGALAVALVGTTGMYAVARQQSAQHQHQATSPDQAMHGDMAAMCQTMVAEHEAADARLTDLAAAMAASTGEAKIAAIEGLLTEFVAQRRTMHGPMMQMHGRMMAQMMSHMGGGMSPEMHESMQKMMADCPMMKAGGGDGAR
jgi:Mg-chelatase subunit ChlI